MAPQRYTLAFIFNQFLHPQHAEVLLITKNLPVWQRDKLNGVGGKIKQGEVISAAVYREVFEETGLRGVPLTWFTAIEDEAETYVVEVFYGQISDAHDLRRDPLKFSPDEPGLWYPVVSLPSNTLFNCRWLIPMLAERIHSNLRASELAPHWIYCKK